GNGPRRVLSCGNAPGRRPRSQLLLTKEEHARGNREGPDEAADDGSDGDLLVKGFGIARIAGFVPGFATSPRIIPRRVFTYTYAVCGGPVGGDGVPCAPRICLGFAEIRVLGGWRA